MIILGLTGSMGCGKTAVATLFIKHGATIIDSDQLARQVVEPGEIAYQQIVEYFGPEILLSDQTLDRKKIAHIVFNDPAKLSHLNSITHRQIAARRDKMLSDIWAQTPHKMVINDVPLLFENGMEHLFQKTLLVCVEPDIQIKRLVQYRGFSAQEVSDRLKNQMKQTDKQAKADYIIDNNGNMANLEDQVSNLILKLTLLPQVSPDLYFS